MGFVNENGVVSSSVESLWRGMNEKKGYGDKLMPFVKKYTRKVYTQQKPQKYSYQKNKLENFTFNSTFK